jgi:hypothetical protein
MQNCSMQKILEQINTIILYVAHLRSGAPSMSTESCSGTIWSETDMLAAAEGSEEGRREDYDGHLVLRTVGI